MNLWTYELMNDDMNDDFWLERGYSGRRSSWFRTGIDTTDDAVQIKPVYPMKMKFDGFEMSEFFQFYIVFSFFNSFFF